MSLSSFMGNHPILVEIAQSGPTSWANRPTLLSVDVASVAKNMHLLYPSAVDGITNCRFRPNDSEGD